LKGATPIIVSAGSWKNLTLSGTIIATARGNRPSLFLRIFSGSMDAVDILRYVQELKRQMGGRKLLLFWDGLPAHRAKIVRAYLTENASWLRAERFPAYAPELNPIEYLWSSMKRKDMGNRPPAGFSTLRRTVWTSKRRLSNGRLLQGFLQSSGLY
jgi:transposase